MARIVRSSILTIAVAALLAPAALAERPDDRAGMLGVGATAATQPTFTHPDNLPGLRGPGMAITAPLARASSAPKVDQLALSYLTGYGLSPSEVGSWTLGACSHQVKAPSCYAMLDPTMYAGVSKQVARLIGTGPDAGRPDDRAGMLGVGAAAASHRTFTHPDDLAGVRGPGAFPSVAAAHPQPAFDWSDAGIGAVTAFALALALFGGVHAFTRERRRHAAA